jgi:hypothetical protein
VDLDFDKVQDRHQGERNICKWSTTLLNEVADLGIGTLNNEKRKFSYWNLEQEMLLFQKTRAETREPKTLRFTERANIFGFAYQVMINSSAKFVENCKIRRPKILGKGSV